MLKFTSFMLCFMLGFMVMPLYAKDEFYGAAVRDISDAEYKPTVIGLIDSASDSIIISVNVRSVVSQGVMSLLLQNLIEAIDRGVSVEIYLNSKFNTGKDIRKDLEEAFLGVTGKGGCIKLVVPRLDLTDSLIIVDKRFVVEGSADWNSETFESMLISATLIDSPELALSRLSRLRRIPLLGEDNITLGQAKSADGAVIIPHGIPLYKALLMDDSLFSTMVALHDVKAMDMYLILLAESTRLNENEFFVSLESIAVELYAQGKWSTVAARRQVVKTLRKLYNRYHLIDVSFRHERDAWISIKVIPGGVFYVDEKFFLTDSIFDMSIAAKFMLMARTLLSSEGKDLNIFSLETLSEIFHLDPETIREALKELNSGEW